MKKIKSEVFFKKTLLFCAALCALLLFAACALSDGTGDAVRTPFDPDLYGWKTASWAPFAINDPITGFAYGTPQGKDRYVAVSSGGVIAWSNDGDIWTQAEKKLPDDTPDASARSFNGVTWGGGRFVAVGSNGLAAWSSDGVSWIVKDNITGFGSENIMAAAYGNGFFVVVGGNSNISWSGNGEVWTSSRDSSFGGSQLNDIVYDGAGHFYIVGNDGKRGFTDNPASNNWNIQALDSPAHSNNIKKVTVGRYGSGICLAIVFDEYGGRRTAIATTGSFGLFDPDLDAGLFGNNAINGIAFGGSWFVAAGQGAMIGWWQSTEPSKTSERYWRALSFPEFQYWEISALAACKDRFFIGNVGGKIGYSK